MHETHKTKEELIAEREGARRDAEFFRAILDNCDDAIQVVREGAVVWTNEASVKQSGYSKEEWHNIDLRDLYLPEELGPMSKVLYDFHVSPAGTAIKVLGRVRVKDGRTQWIESSMVRHPDPPIEGTIAVARVVSGRKGPPLELKLTREADAPFLDLSARDEALGTIFNNVSDAIIVHDPDGTIQYVNRTAFEMLGLSPDQVRPTTLADQYYGPMGGRGNMIGAIWERVLAGESERHEWQIEISGGVSLRDVEVFMRKIRVEDRDCILAVISDMTYRKQAEKRLKSMLAEKEALLRETHHRVKNNFTLISSLLRLQARRAKDRHLREMLNEADFRVRCMGKVHEKLHQAESLSELRIRDYLVGLVDNIIETHGEKVGNVIVRTDIEEVSLEPDVAVPLGFITSELCTNCFKHAFPGERGGEISITLQRVSVDDFELVVRDNGVGIPENLDMEELASLGLKLVKMFVEQLDGAISVNVDNGTQFTIAFSSPLEMVPP